MSNPTQGHMILHADYQDNEMFGNTQLAPESSEEVPYVLYQNPPLVVGPEPCIVTCPGCKETAISAVKYTAGNRTHNFAMLLGLFTLGLLSWIPYCFRSCKNADHYCQKCGRFIGFYNGEH